MFKICNLDKRYKQIVNLKKKKATIVVKTIFCSLNICQIC